jgi:hypothetical protein
MKTVVCIFLAFFCMCVFTYYFDPEVMKTPGDAAGWAAVGMAGVAVALGVILDALTD